MQDWWSGFFPLKWHIVKDIPNYNFREITLENNDNKVVTFSRDTQEVIFWVKYAKKKHLFVQNKPKLAPLFCQSFKSCLNRDIMQGDDWNEANALGNMSNMQ